MNENNEIGRHIPPPENSNSASIDFYARPDINDAITKEREHSPARAAKMETEANILRSLATDPAHLGLTQQEMDVVLKYARAAGEKAGKQADELEKADPITKLRTRLSKAADDAKSRTLEKGNLSALDTGIVKVSEQLSTRLEALSRRVVGEDKPQMNTLLVAGTYNGQEVVRVFERSGASADGDRALIDKLTGILGLQPYATIDQLKKEKDWKEIAPAGSLMGKVDGVTDLPTDIPGVTLDVTSRPQMSLVSSKSREQFGLQLNLTPEAIRGLGRR